MTHGDPKSGVAQADAWPEAFLVGAPKCGTTALAHYLAEHPRIAVSLPKEPGYLADDLRGLWVVADDAGYRALFAGGDRLRLDASIWYLYSQTAAPRIAAIRPDARVVVMLRNPVMMVPSLHRQLLNTLDEDEPDFATAWALCAARARGERLPRKCRAPSTLLYDRVAAFGAQLKRLFSHIPPERVLVLFQEELKRDPAAVYARTLAFLDMPDDRRTDFAPVNEAVGYRNTALQQVIKRGVPGLSAVAAPIRRALGVKSLGFREALNRVNRAAPENTAMPAALQAEIAAAYRDDMNQLATLLRRDLAAEFGWPL